MGPIAVFGIDNDGVNLAVNVLILFLVVIWLALVFWTYADARRRLDDPMLVACATAASLFPYVGTIVYAIVRPPEFLDEVYLRNLEISAAEERLRQLEQRGQPDAREPRMEGAEPAPALPPRDSGTRSRRQEATAAFSPPALAEEPARRRRPARDA